MSLRDSGLFSAFCQEFETKCGPLFSEGGEATVTIKPAPFQFIQKESHHVKKFFVYKYNNRQWTLEDLRQSNWFEYPFPLSAIPMHRLEKVLVRPKDFADGPTAVEWFDQIANYLLNECRLLVGTAPHRLTEIEFYYHHEAHADPFAHCDPIQREMGRWYFHRTRGTYRSGSFKGLDLSFGDNCFAGVLLRGAEEIGGDLIDGPSLLVDHLLKKTGHAKVSSLDKAIGTLQAWDATNVLLFDDLPDAEERRILRTARVGLTLRKAATSPDQPQFLLRRYRYLTEPAQIKKGKLQMILALHADGHSPEEIRAETGAAPSSIRRAIEYFTGENTDPLESFFGRDLATHDLCVLHRKLWNR